MTPSLEPRRRRWSWPISIRIEPRLDQPRGLGTAVSLGAVLVALALGALVLEIVGGDSLRAYSFMLKASFGSAGVISDTLVKATPLILVGLACTVAFRMRLWNIGAEGQFYMGAFAASAVVLAPILPAETPRWLMLLAMLVAGFIGGAVWGFIPGILKARLNVNEIITTLMLNYIALAWVNFWVFAVWTEGGFQMTPVFPKSAWMPRLADYAESFSSLRGITLHLGLLVGLVAAVIIWWVLDRSKWGYEVKLTGDNPRAARYAGIPIALNTVLVLMLSGGLAGLAGMSEISGVVHRLQSAISPGYGFTGIIIAWLAKLNPLVVVPVSILFGALILAGREIQPSGVPKMIQGIVLVCLIASDFLIRNRIRVVVRRREG